MPAAAPAKPAKKPLVNNTRRRFQRAKNPLAFNDFNQQQTMTFDQVGYCNGLLLECSFAITDTAGSPSTAAPAQGMGPWSMVKRVQLETNLGTSMQYDCSGWGASIVQQLYDRNVDFRTAYGTSDTVDPLYAYPVTGYAQNTPKTTNFNIFLPVALNDGDQFTIGLLNLQAPEVSATLRVITGAKADFLNTADTITISGSVNVEMQYYEVPSPQRNVEEPLRIMNRYIENRQTITAGGENIVTIQRQGKLLRLAHWVTANGVLDTAVADVQGFQWVGNTSDFIERRTSLSMLADARKRYGGKAMPPGVYVYDWFNASAEVNRGGLRDVYDTQKISVLESRVELAQGITLGSGNNFIDSLRHLLQSY